MGVDPGDLTKPAFCPMLHCDMTTPDETQGMTPAPPAPYGRIAVLGMGAWGTALAATAARAGASVTLWGRSARQAARIAATGRNERYLPRYDLPDGITPTADPAEAVAGAEAILLVTPSGSVRQMAKMIADHAPAAIPVFVCAKGIEEGTGLLMAEVAADAAPGRTIGVISGPTFATETVAEHPTAVTVACDGKGEDGPSSTAAARMARTLTTDTFRPYVSNDIVGVEVGGAVKNVIAIACGILAGAGFGENTRAAIITRGLQEMKELAVRLGGTRETVTGLSGIGDLMLTCSSTQSRNFSYGLQRGKGIAEKDVFEGKPVVVEGRLNAKTVTDLARRLGLHMPICEMVRSVTADGRPIGEAFAAYWAAPIESEPRDLALKFAHPAESQAAKRFGDLLP
ncbi:MAG: NAD(P)H-dependent glycerol-3-phosphate dehydrogenase [Rubricella sp.]